MSNTNEAPLLDGDLKETERKRLAREEQAERERRTGIASEYRGFVRELKDLESLTDNPIYRKF
ncbi:MAG TPA: hypothetical protein VGM92_15475, partial [Candidatus Kapabacteria bacterium]